MQSKEGERTECVGCCARLEESRTPCPGTDTMRNRRFVRANVGGGEPGDVGVNVKVIDDSHSTTN